MIRPYTPSDYDLIQVWGKARNFPIVPPDYLPATGFIDPEHCVAFLYKTDSKIAWLEWVVSNPESNRVLRGAALNDLLATVIQHAKDLGFGCILTSLEHQGLMERYKMLGFVPTDTGVTNMYKGLG